MPLRLISNPRHALLFGLITVGGLVAVVSKQLPNFERATALAPADSQEGTKSASVYIAKSSVPPIAPAADAKQGSAGRDNALWSIPLASLTATRERPIFSLTRRPPPAPVKSAPTPAPLATQPPLALVGAIAGEDEGIAIFLDGITKGIIRMKTGESHAGWTLQAVKAREAVLQNEQKTATLVLPNPPAK